MSDSVPENPCPACGTKLPKGAARCFGCGRVFGEDNRCGSCHAIAAVKRVAGGYSCSACGKPREKKPGTTVLDDGVSPGAPSATTVAKVGSTGLGAIGAGVIGIGAVTATALLFLLPFPVSLGIAALVMGVTGIVGGGALFFGLRGRNAADKARERQMSKQILTLARDNAGELTASQVAEAIGVTTKEADEGLTSMAHGSGVSVEVDASGVVRYVFNELLAGDGPRVRVDASVMPREIVEELEAHADTLSASKQRR